MAIAHVQSKAAGELTSTTPQVTLTAAPTQGNLLTAAVRVLLGPTITAAGSWTMIGSVFAGGSTTVQIATFWKIAGAGESTTQQPCTIGTSNIWVCGIGEYSGVDTTTPVDVHDEQPQASSTSYVAPSVTPVASVERLLIAAYTSQNGGKSFSAEQIGGTSTGVNERIDSASLCVTDRIVASTSGSYGGTATLSNPANAGANATIAYAVASAATKAPPPFRRPLRLWTRRY